MGQITIESNRKSQYYRIAIKIESAPKESILNRFSFQNRFPALVASQWEQQQQACEYSYKLYKVATFSSTVAKSHNKGS